MRFFRRLRKIAFKQPGNLEYITEGLEEEDWDGIFRVPCEASRGLIACEQPGIFLFRAEGLEKEEGWDIHGSMWFFRRIRKITLRTAKHINVQRCLEEESNDTLISSS